MKALRMLLTEIFSEYGKFFVFSQYAIKLKLFNHKRSNFRVINNTKLLQEPEDSRKSLNTNKKLKLRILNWDENWIKSTIIEKRKKLISNKTTRFIWDWQTHFELHSARKSKTQLTKITAKPKHSDLSYKNYKVFLPIQEHTEVINAGPRLHMVPCWWLRTITAHWKLEITKLPLRIRNPLSKRRGKRGF